MDSPARTFSLAMLFESGLGFLGIFLAWIFAIPLESMLVPRPEAFLRGVIACLPLLVLLIVVSTTHWQPFVDLRRQVEQLVRELFGASRWFELAMVSTAAGIGEEILFRGVLQAGLAQWTHPVVAVFVVGLLFGLAHAVSTIYFAVATLIGCYFGWLSMAYADLIAPIVAHALYDFLALSYFLHSSRKQRE